MIQVERNPQKEHDNQWEGIAVVGFGLEKEKGAVDDDKAFKKKPNLL